MSFLVFGVDRSHGSKFQAPVAMQVSIFPSYSSVFEFSFCFSKSYTHDQIKCFEDCRITEKLNQMCEQRANQQTTGNTFSIKLTWQENVV